MLGKWFKKREKVIRNTYRTTYVFVDLKALVEKIDRMAEVIQAPNTIILYMPSDVKVKYDHIPNTNVVIVKFADDDYNYDKATYIQTKREGITDEFEFDEIYCMPDAIREALDKSKDRTVCITK